MMTVAEEDARQCWLDTGEDGGQRVILADTMETVADANEDSVAEEDLVTEEDSVAEEDSVTEEDSVAEEDAVTEEDSVAEEDAVTEEDLVAEDCDGSRRRIP
jgi:hypothetical protein